MVIVSRGQRACTRILCMLVLVSLVFAHTESGGLSLYIFVKNLKTGCGI